MLVLGDYVLRDALLDWSEEELKYYLFKPEFQARLDEKLLFNELSIACLAQVQEVLERMGENANQAPSNIIT